jgi:hypothetical protein
MIMVPTRVFPIPVNHFILKSDETPLKMDPRKSLYSYRLAVERIISQAVLKY